MNKPIGMAVAAITIGLVACPAAQAAPSSSAACFTRAPIESEAIQPGARSASGEALELGARNASGESLEPGARNASDEKVKLPTGHPVGGENNPVYPTKTTQFVGSDGCSPN